MQLLGFSNTFRSSFSSYNQMYRKVYWAKHSPLETEVYKAHVVYFIAYLHIFAHAPLQISCIQIMKTIVIYNRKQQKWWPGSEPNKKTKKTYTLLNVWTLNH